jgi:enamine deaminase RidA (YjgF/YER057c/UK114 family)
MAIRLFFPKKLPKMCFVYKFIWLKGFAMSLVEERLKSFGFVLPPVVKTSGLFVPYVVSGSMIYLSGKGAPVRQPMELVPKVGAEVSVEQAQQYAQEVALYLIALMKEAVGDLDRIQRIVKLLGMVNAVPNFMQHTEVINGCSDVFVKAFGERGHHARSAVGMASLPKGFAVEIEAVVEFL